VTCNHYTRPGLPAWWLVLTVSASVAACRAPEADPEICWTMTADWTFPDTAWKRWLLTPVTRWAFSRVAQVYSFLPMPAMPPSPGQEKARALAVLRVLRLARQLAHQGGMIGLGREDRDNT
jgi:hypothetical protein